MITRLSKIARLPANIRDQLNRRLHDGELSRTILPWLNNLPKTRKVLRELFHGKPITHQNLSEWRRAGYQDWLFHQQRLDWFNQLTEQSEDLKKYDGSPDTYETMANIFLFEIGQAITLMKATQDPNQRCDRLQNLIREFARLQNAYNFSRRVELDYVKHNNSGTGILPVRSVLGPPAPVAPKSGEGGSRRPGTIDPQPSEVTEKRSAHPTAGGASVPASRTPHETNGHEPIALSDAPRNPAPSAERASILDCGSPLPLPVPNCQPIPTLATTPNPAIHLPNIHSPVPPRPYKPHANPIRGRRFTCIEG